MIFTDRISQDHAVETDGFKSELALAGIGSPFDESTFINIKVTFDFDTIEYNKAVQDALLAEESEIMDLVALTKEDERVNWNEEGDKVLLLTFHHYPDSYPEGETVTTGSRYMWTVTDKEFVEWYEENNAEIVNTELAVKQLLGMPSSSNIDYVSAV